MNTGRCFAVTLSTALLAVSSHSALSAQVYRWVDANGRVQFGDRPHGDSAQAITMPSLPAAKAAPSDAERAETQRHLLQIFATEREEKALAAKKAKENAAERQKKCTIAKDDLQQMRTAGVLYDLDAAGNRRILSDAEHAEAHRRAEETVATWCD